jgi:hypothetical protein
MSGQGRSVTVTTLPPARRQPEPYQIIHHSNPNTPTMKHAPASKISRAYSGAESEIFILGNQEASLRSELCTRVLLRLSFQELGRSCKGRRSDGRWPVGAIPTAPASSRGGVESRHAAMAAAPSPDCRGMPVGLVCRSPSTKRSLAGVAPGPREANPRQGPARCRAATQYNTARQHRAGEARQFLLSVFGGTSCTEFYAVSRLSPAKCRDSLCRAGTKLSRRQIGLYLQGGIGRTRQPRTLPRLTTKTSAPANDGLRASLNCLQRSHSSYFRKCSNGGARQTARSEGA